MNGFSAAAHPMDGARDELLAAAGLALDQHGSVHARDVPNLFEDHVHRRAASDQLLEPVLCLALRSQRVDFGDFI
jgi:hypothetical protein